ncbi:MAG TPA: NEL-type E3 ubiquitin ligase domain-containing protein [Candidatus Rhabdochlamydia sp.]|jgi:Leucine-rich repeat (LRR) protein|nr:NEL-type E3 ubiquitin ligase domain-containing protein [Candidatus Rhabdochlamydia sp.]
MLHLSKKFFNSANYIQQGFKVCFNPKKNKLAFYRHEKANENITDLQEIVNYVNQLPKPTFNQVLPYCNLYKKIESINELISPKKEISINLEKFNENFKPETKDLNEHFLELSVLSRNVFQRLKNQIQIELTFLLDKWIKENPQETNRILAKNTILDVFNKEETFLNLNGLDISSLPDIFNIGNLQKLITLDLSENRLITLPESISQVSLETLDLASNNLEIFPETIANLPSLKQLNFEDNNIAALPEVINLPLLVNLNLSYNQLVTSSCEAICNLRSLAELDLESNNLEALPEAICNLRSLTNLNLSNNPISGIPMQILDLPNTCDIDFIGCYLSEAVLLRLHEITNSPDYLGPRISFSIIDKKENEEKSIKESLTELYYIADKTPSEFSNLKETAELCSWLHRLSDIADYQKKDLQKAFANKIIEYLNLANTNQEFCEIFYNIIQDASETCGDRVALSVLHLGITHKLAMINLKDMQTLADFLTKGVWAIDMLENIARDKILTLPLFDEIEVYLGYLVKLKKSLQIPIDIEEMLYFTCSALKPQDLEEAKTFVKNQLKNKEAYYEFLSRNDKWQEALSVNYKEEYEAISNRRMQAAELENPNYMAIDQKFKEELKKLTKRALSKRARLDLDIDNSLCLDKPKNPNK